MAIKTESDRAIPYLKKYTPYTPPANAISSDSIGSMVSYNLQKNKTLIQYFPGASGNIDVVFTIKNMTANTELEITYFPIQNYLLIKPDTTSSDPINNTLIRAPLLPKQTKNFYIVLYKQYLDSIDSAKLLETNLTFNVNNVYSGGPTIRDSTLEPVSPVTLPLTLTVT